MIQTPFAKPDRYVHCPSCGKGDHRVDHLEVGGKAGSWYCDECGVAFKVEVVSETLVKTEPTDEKKFAADAHLVLEDPGLLPLTFIVRGMVFGKVGQTAEEVLKDKDDRYLYESHHCPTNFLQDVKKIIAVGGDDDPHGLFRWEKTVPPSVDAETIAAPPFLPDGTETRR